MMIKSCASWKRNELFLWRSCIPGSGQQNCSTKVSPVVVRRGEKKPTDACPDVHCFLIHYWGGKLSFADWTKRAPEVCLPGFRRSGVERNKSERHLLSTLSEEKPTAWTGVATSVPQLDPNSRTTSGYFTNCISCRLHCPSAIKYPWLLRINTNTEDCQYISIHCRQTRQTLNFRLFIFFSK